MGLYSHWLRRVFDDAYPICLLQIWAEDPGKEQVCTL